MGTWFWRKMPLSKSGGGKLRCGEWNTWVILTLRGHCICQMSCTCFNNPVYLLNKKLMNLHKTREIWENCFGKLSKTNLQFTILVQLQKLTELILTRLILRPRYKPASAVAAHRTVDHVVYGRGQHISCFAYTSLSSQLAEIRAGAWEFAHAQCAQKLALLPQ